ncbi:L,D-transpeptidase family protein [Solitalea canadensis]|uniref:L,D-TPase catalytic domain-containing protein n=1 Tax=Solitalea canadensis (strain ATCC 29591 / DSM 3403 / JCM 21819 / LMG 8368 / NBRC 15130 / NCIMB 12057 / USAM 9D) TaxID=929556 RepID=H8KLG8_SOLCM|nr:L,D-transpeptidase family protein [Solitalea canadensis]AFD08855.1 hypothetical protein Solca_3858 [Solitalea canadensis DSM 3403]
MKKALLISFSVLAIFTQSCKSQKVNLTKQFQSEQLIVVTAADWTTIQAEMNVYELENGQWKSVMEHIPVTLGRTGLAWGKGLHDEKLNVGELKKEGDGKSPAGIFRLNGLFAYDDFKTKMPLLKVDTNTFCVDDKTSPFYNQIVSTDTTAKNWNSAEEMRRKDDFYKYGVFVGYNTDQIVAGAGSCIFMHLWRGSDRPTAGCTAMMEENMVALFEFLDPAKKPILVQVPKNEYENIKEIYELP